MSTAGQGQPSRGTLGGYRTETWPGRTVVLVPSRSDPEITYRVAVAAGLAECTCPGYGYRGNCAHADAVAELILAAPTAASAST